MTLPPRKALLLAFRTIEGRPTELGKARHGSAAAGPRTAQAFPVVDRESVLEIAQLAVGAAMVAQSRAARLDRFLEHGADGFDQRMGGARRISGRAGES